MQVLQGIAVSPGVAIGEAFVIDREGFRIPRRFVTRDAVDSEVERLDRAIEAAAVEIQANEVAVSRELGKHYGAIFNAHHQMLRDPKLHSELVEHIRTRNFTPEYAVSRVLRSYAKIFQNLENLADRANDIYDLEKRLLRNLLGRRREEIFALTSPVLVLAHNLTPSETAHLDRQFVRGFVTETGGASSHTAIVAGALKIPAVVGTGPFLSDVSGGEVVIIDGDHGQVILHPDEETLARFRHEAEQNTSLSRRLESLRDLPAETKDGLRISILANIEFPHEVANELAKGSDGIGLYRTEFLYLGTDSEPTEEDHYQAYCQVLDAMGQKPVVIRTLDLGADKLANLASRPVSEEEKNPFLGLRSIRLSLRNLPMFRTQLRAILRASVRGNARVMFPLISTVSELRQAKMVLADVLEDLDEAGVEHISNLPIGMMVEVPAAAVLIDRFAREVDFFSLGTNDLIQYTLAVDRGNKDVASLYSASDPAILRLIDQVVKGAAPNNVPVNLCGQMSSSPIYTMLLIGLGLRQLSVTPSVVPEIKQVCRHVTLPQCQAVAAKALTMEVSRDITRYLQEELKKVAPEMMS